MSYYDVYKTESQFKLNCPVASQIISYANSLDSNTKWFFKVCHVHQLSYTEYKYQVLFDPPYGEKKDKGYCLSLEAVLIEDKPLDIKIIKKVDNL